MKRNFPMGLVVASGLALAVLPGAALAAGGVVNIQLQDSTTGSGISKMQMVLDHDVVPAGKVTLRAKNESKQLVHEVLVFRDTGKPLPYDSKAGEIVEKRAHSLGEVSDLRPGKSGQKTFNLKPGTYFLICNQPMHLKSGMYARLKVVAAGTQAGNEKLPTTPPPTLDVK